MPAMSQVTALVKTFCRDEYLFSCVKSLRETYPAIRIVVADDGHHSGEKEDVLRGWGVERYIRMQFASGLSRGRNALVDAAETDYALLGDDDFCYGPNSRAEALLSLMDVADIACGSAVRDGVIHRYEYAIEALSGRMRFVRMRDEYMAHGATRYAKVGLALNFFLAKTATLRSLRWDDEMRIRWEHEDFFLRAHAAGVRVVFCPDAKVIHRRGPPDTDEYARHRRDDAGSRIAFMARWGASFRSPWESNFEEA